MSNASNFSQPPNQEPLFRTSPMHTLVCVAEEVNAKKKARGPKTQAALAEGQALASSSTGVWCVLVPYSGARSHLLALDLVFLLSFFFLGGGGGGAAASAE